MVRTLGAMVVLMASQSVEAQPQVCAHRQSLLDSLAHDYSEAPAGLGVANNGTVIELLTARDGKTWTLLLTTPDGISCVVAAGEGWENLPQVAAGNPS